MLDRHVAWLNVTADIYIILIHYMHHFISTIDGTLDFVTGIWTEIRLGTGIRFHPSRPFLIKAKITQHSVLGNWKIGRNKLIIIIIIKASQGVVMAALHRQISVHEL
jgi:hypothetical protein